MNAKQEFDNARNAYEKLTIEQKEFVRNRRILVQSESDYMYLMKGYNSKVTITSVFVVLGGIVALLAISYILMFFVFNKWIELGDRIVRAVKLGHKKGKMRLLLMPFRFEYRDEKEIYNTKTEALR